MDLAGLVRELDWRADHPAADPVIDEHFPRGRMRMRETLRHVEQGRPAHLHGGQERAPVFEIASLEDLPKLADQLLLHRPRLRFGERDQLFPAEQQRIVRLLIDKVIVSPDDIEVRFRPNGIEVLALELRPEPAPETLEEAVA